MTTAIKKLCGLTLLVTMLLCIFAMPAFAAGETFSPDGDPLTYTVLDGSTVAVSGCESGQSAVVIPGTVQNGGTTYTVTQVARGALAGNTSVESLTIPASVQKIGDRAFSSCIRLSEVNFASGSQLTEIGKAAFAYNGKDSTTVPATIASLTLPASLQTLGSGAFHGIPVEKFALEDGSQLTEIPDGFLAADGKDGYPGEETQCESIWDYATEWFVNLTSPYPSTPAQVAKACDCLQSIDLGENNSLTRIGMGAFKNQTHLTSIDFGVNVADNGLTIARGAFVAVGNNGAAGGENPGGIDTLTLPANLVAIESRAFDFARIRNLVFSDDCKLAALPDGFMEIGTKGSNGYPGKNTDGDFVKDPAQIAANSLETIDFGENNSLESIGNAAFKNQSHLTAIDFDSSRASELRLGNGCFIGAGNNGYLVDNGVDESLNGGIRTLTLPANLTMLGYGCFDYARIRNLVFSDNCKLQYIPGGFLEVFGEGSNGYPGRNNSGEFVKEQAQIASNSLETINFGENNSLTSIGGGAFKNQSHLTYIDFGTSDAGLSINGGAFVGAGNNAYLVENGIDSTLNGGIETLTLPANLATLNTAFEYARIKNVVFSDNCRLMNIPSNFLGINGQGSNGYPGKDPNGKFVNDPVQQACNCLKTVDFGENNSLRSISSSAFRNQSHMIVIDFGTSVSSGLSISSGAFIGVGNNGYLVDNGVDSALNEGIETLVFPSNLTGLNSGFEYARIKNVVFSDDCKLTTIGSNFLGINGEGCNGQPGKNTDGKFVKDQAQLAANSLETVSLGENNHIGTITSSAFRNQSHLTNIDFGTSAATSLRIEGAAFTGAGNNSYLVENGADESLNAGLGSLTLPANLTSLGGGAFDFAGFKSLSFGEGSKLSSLGGGSFQDLTVLKTLVIGSDCPVTKLESGQFSKCTDLTTVNLLNSNIATIGDSLKENKKLKRIIFPKTLQSITWTNTSREKECPFYGCDNVEKLYFSGTDPSEYSLTDDVLQFLNTSGIVYVPEGTTAENIQNYKKLLEDAGLSFDTGKWVIDTWTPGEVHEMEKVEAKAPTCTEDGNNEYYECVICDNIFKDEDGTTETTVAAETLPALGHLWGEWTAVTDTHHQAVCLRDSNHVKTEKHTFEDGKCTVCGYIEKTVPVLPSFVDVDPDAYYYDPVNWAVNEGITKGMDDTHFNPDGQCTRSQAVTFLWRAVGSPAPKSSAMPFEDVQTGSYYYNAVLWAVEKGITKGTSNTSFSPDMTCSRGQIITFLWRTDGSPEGGTDNPFVDVRADAYYADAVLWAVKEDITKGTSATQFSPDNDCTRAQIVTFIYRYMK